MTTKHNRNKWGALAILLAVAALPCLATPDRMEMVYVGSGRTNIYGFALNLTGGTLAPLGILARMEAPSFLAVTANQKFLYAVSEGQDKETSTVAAFKIDGKSGKLAWLNQQATGGAGPCHVSVDRDGRDVLAANYNSGSVVVFPLDIYGSLNPASAFIQDQGSSVNRSRQAGPHAHCIVTSPDDRYAFVCDLGLDKIMSFKFDSVKGKLTPNDLAFTSMKPGEGPRHLAFHPNGRYAYAVTEMGCTINTFTYDSERGILSQIQELSLLPADFKGQNTAAEVAVHPSGNFVYASNRGDDSIMVFRCDPATGTLAFVQREYCGGRTPRNFEIDPTGEYLLSADSDSGIIVVFSIDQKTGRLRPTGNEAAVEMPMCIKCLQPAALMLPAATAVPAAAGTVPTTSLPYTPVTPAPPLTPATPGIPQTPLAPQTPPDPVTPTAAATPAVPTTPATPAPPVTPPTPAQ